ncbi:uncharacterized protein LOC116291828 [Actinia tenebrosa]|uniref:Uncharacterized protein LOC116291828 n=1 Tax=Actinia tenebrosa TaxID=6105 RepID=A0A6P8HJ75_ACTTE|nr:uncharacterized protein LOC116291828 [Actinia tenebrosa]
MVIRRFLVLLGRCILRRLRVLLCLLVILIISMIYITFVTNNRLELEITPHLGIIKPKIHVKMAGRSLSSLAIIGTDISSKKLKLLSAKFKYLLILPHATQRVIPAMGAPFIGNVDKLKLQEIMEFLDSTEDIYHAGTCQMMNSNKPVVKKLSCYFEVRNWTMLIENNGRKRTEVKSNRLVNIVECNMFEGAFVIRRRIFEKFYLLPAYGDTVLFDFFLRTKGKIKIALLTDCSLSDELHRADRGALRSKPFYTDYIKLGFDHDVVRIIKENQMIWTKCSYNLRLCPEKALQLKYSLSRQLRPVCCSEVLDRMLVDVVQSMNAVSLDYRVEYGTLLGAVRSGTIIPWTRDVDIGLREDDYFKDEIFDKLKGSSSSTKPFVPSRKWHEQRLGGKILDIWTFTLPRKRGLIVLQKLRLMAGITSHLLMQKRCSRNGMDRVT